MQGAVIRRICRTARLLFLAHRAERRALPRRHPASGSVGCDVAHFHLDAAKQTRSPRSAWRVCPARHPLGERHRELRMPTHAVEGSGRAEQPAASTAGGSVSSPAGSRPGEQPPRTPAASACSPGRRGTAPGQCWCRIGSLAGRASALALGAGRGRLRRCRSGNGTDTTRASLAADNSARGVARRRGHHAHRTGR